MKVGRVLFSVALAACGALATVPSAAIGATADSSAAAPSWMTVDAAKKAVSFDIEMAENGNNGTLNFNGYGHGAMTLVVPLGWTVNMHVVNHGAGAIPHSLEVLPITESIPNQGSDPPAFAGAETNNLVEGMKVAQSDDLTFVADTAGKYWLFCGVPNHGIGGMYDYLLVSTTATAPAVKIDASAAK
jgi:sulfocyanin